MNTGCLSQHCPLSFRHCHPNLLQHVQCLLCSWDLLLWQTGNLFQHCDTLAPIYTQANAVQPPFGESLVRAYPAENRPT